MFKNLMVPLDGSPFAEHAIASAISIAAKSHATLHLAMVHTPVATPYDAGMLAFDATLDVTLRERENAYLEKITREVANQLKQPVKYQLLDGAIADTLTDHAGKVQADLVVMTTHGRGAMSRFWLGSVADRLVRHLAIHLLLVRPKEEPVNFAIRPQFRKILVPLDGSDFSGQVLPSAISFGESTEAEYHLLRVISPVAPHFQTRFADPNATEYGLRYEHQLDAIQEKVRQEALTYLEKIAEPLRRSSHRVHTSVAINDQPSAAILEASQKLSADLIAIKTHGRHGLSRMILGSVADKVLRGSTVPVLL